MDDRALRPAVMTALLNHLRSHPGDGWYQIDRALSGRVDVGPYMNELKELEKQGKIRSESGKYWVVNEQ